MLALYTVIGIATIYVVVKWVGTDATPPAPSYQEKNLEVLKAAQPNDLLLCVVEKKDSSLAPDIWAAILVDQNDGGFLHGYTLNSRQLNYIQNGGYPYGRFSKCEARIVKEPFARETIGRIILHGLNQPPAK